MRAKLPLTLLLTFSFYLLSSQVPSGFNYQAIARDGSGEPMTGPLTVKITILSQITPVDIKVYEETHSNVNPDVHGLFSIVVGNGSADFGTFAAINWNLSTLYLRTTINGTVLTPDTKLMSVPYSMVSDKANGISEGEKISITGDPASVDALFEVKRTDGQVVFAVYPDAVSINLPPPAKGTKGGFSVGGFGAKVDPVPYLEVTRDYTEVNVNRLAAKGSKGGFTVGGFDGAKIDPSSFMTMTPENYFIGEGSGIKITDGKYNSTLGYNAGSELTTAWNNVLIGFSSGTKTTTGSNNLFIGNNSGKANINGENNIFLGVSAGTSNTGGAQSWMGSNNIFVGLSSGLNNTTGGSNIFIGSNAGWSNLDGNLNIYIGDRSGFSSTGVRNTFIGASTGEGNNAGNDNIYIGNQTGQISTGSENTFIGSIAGWKNGTGSGNVYVGYVAGTQIVDGTKNTFVGTNTGGWSITGSQNTYLGYYAGASNDGNGNVFIGHKAGYLEETGNNKLFIHNDLNGPDDALIYGEFDNHILKLNGKVTVRDVLKLKPGTAPSSPEEGDIYYDAALKKLRVFDGTDWQSCW